MSRFAYWFFLRCERFVVRVKQTNRVIFCPITKIIFVISICSCDSFFVCLYACVLCTKHLKERTLHSFTRGDDFIKMDNNHLSVEWRPNVFFFFAQHCIYQCEFFSAYFHHSSLTFILFFHWVTFLFKCFDWTKKNTACKRIKLLRHWIDGAHTNAQSVSNDEKMRCIDTNAVFHIITGNARLKSGFIHSFSTVVEF